MSMTPLPSAPARSDAPATFISKADAFIASLPNFVTEANALQTDVTTKQTTASTAATNASTSATNAASSATSASTSATTATTQASNASTSATNAASSATAAATSATNAATSATTAANAAASTAVNPYVFSTTTTMADPGVGGIRFNNATVSSVTAIAIDAQTNDSGNPNILNYITTWDDSTSSVKGQLVLKKSGTPSTFVVFNITGLTNNTGWVQLTVSHVASNGTWSASDTAYVQFLRTGDAGNGVPSNLTLTNPATAATLTVANNGSLITSGAYAVTLTATSTTNATLPAGTTTLAQLGANTFTAAQNYSDQQNSRAMLIDCGYVFVDKGNSGTTTQTLDYTAGSHQKITATGNHTIATSNWPPSGNLGEMLLELVNGGAYTVTWPTISWVKPDGTTTTSISTYLAANTGRTSLQSSGTDFILLWTRDVGTTIFGKLV